ncbi:SLC13 family permease [Opitutales bacterium]|nr:SLC13 family permease [Opitutales bacterium]
MIAVETYFQIEIIFAILILLCAVTSFAMEKVRIEVTAVCLYGIILLLTSIGFENWPTSQELIMVFSSEAPLAIIAMFMVSGALSRQGVIERLTTNLQQLTRLGYRPFLLILLFSVAFFSAFINNTPVVVILLPVAIGLSGSLGVPSSKLLIPLSYASIFGGCCTLIGTSTNILASGFMANSRHYPDMSPMNMFELSKIGLPLMLFGLAFLIVFGRRLLPEREALSKILSEIERKEFLTEAILIHDSPLIGKTIKNSPISMIEGVRLIDTVRGGKSLTTPIDETVLHSGDRLILSCKPQGLIEVREVEGFKFFDQSFFGMEPINTSEAIMVEAMIKPSSSLLSCSLLEANFRGRFNLSVVALHRKGKNLHLSLNALKLRVGDTLLLLGTDSGVEELRESGEAVLLDKPPINIDKKTTKTIFSITVLAAIIVSASLSMIPLYLAALLGAGCLMVGNCINLKEAFKAVEWNLLLLIYAMLALGIVMEKSGASALMADLIRKVCTQGLSEDWQIIGALVAIYLFTAVLTELLSNNATIAIMTPVALGVAFQFGVSTEVARAFVLTSCIAASASFITPIGYQTNTFVYTVGGYRFKDFAKFGIWPMLIYFIGTILLVGFYWNLFP